ncbi:sensor histidine kinase [Actinoplanes solisilvae]|uniref:sensor histidine kinase n=1 Tax=Actinoplanes solisilvae TaxID=2486853 RepID=UPI0013E2AD02|nr:sensor histidine kinase [Actinoplanes solisilvae]
MGRKWSDVAVAVGVLALDAGTALSTAGGDDRPLMPWGWVLLVAASVALVWRQRFPLSVLAVTAAATLPYYTLGFADAPIVLALVIALYTVARDRGPGLALGVAGGLAAAFAATADEPLAVAAGVVPVLLLPVVLGEVARGRVRRTAQAEDRARLAEARAEQEALRGAAEERLRIARELHDVLAHQLALINVQSGAALHTREPDSAFEALRAIRTASGDALREIRSVLGVLREPVQPDLAALPELFNRAQETGLTVRARVSLPPPVVPPAVQLAAYRILQEALTNVVRHSSAGAVDVRVEQTGGQVEILVEDDGRSEGEVENGNGLRGMAERAAAVGGEFQAGPRPGGGFRVLARLPAGNGAR